jgi:hypothetical protein
MGEISFFSGIDTVRSRHILLCRSRAVILRTRAALLVRWPDLYPVTTVTYEPSGVAPRSSVKKWVGTILPIRTRGHRRDEEKL